MTLDYKGQSITFDMPGWHCDALDHSVHSGKDIKVSDRMLNQLKGRGPEGRSLSDYPIVEISDYAVKLAETINRLQA